MRTQFFDGFDFAHFKYSIVAIEHMDEFFKIETYGIHPVIYDESCLRGYSCIFGISDSRHLILRKLFTNTNGRPAPTIDGIEPVPFHSPAGDLRYDLEHIIPTRAPYLSPMVSSTNTSYLLAFRFPMPLKKSLNSPSTMASSST